MAEPNLQHRVAVITGAAGRLGRRMVERFIREGASVAAVVRNPQEIGSITFPGHQQGRAFQADTADESSVTACFREIHGHFGRLDVLVHTVGMWSGKPFLDTSLMDWESLLRTNLTSAFLCFREAARAMDGHSGRLIGFTSATGADQGRAQQAAYSAAKAGIIRLVESVAAELKDTGITAHAVAPTTILYEDPPESKGVRADDIIGACVFLCSDAGAAFNGKILRAYGISG